MRSEAAVAADPVLVRAAPETNMATRPEPFRLAARDFNCLADPDRKTRQRALQKLGALARSPPPELDGEILGERHVVERERDRDVIAPVTTGVPRAAVGQVARCHVCEFLCENARRFGRVGKRRRVGQFEDLVCDGTGHFFAAIANLHAPHSSRAIEQLSTPDVSQKKAMKLSSDRDNPGPSIGKQSAHEIPEPPKTDFVQDDGVDAEQNMVAPKMIPSKIERPKNEATETLVQTVPESTELNTEATISGQVDLKNLASHEILNFLAKAIANTTADIVVAKIVK